MTARNKKKGGRVATRKQRINQVFALLWVILGVFVVTQSRNVEYWSEFGPGPGFLPFWIGIGFFIAGLVVLVQFTFGRREEEEISLPGRLSTRQMILVMAAFFGFVFLAERVGFIICIGLMFFFLLAVVEKKGWKFSLAVAISNALIFWLVFELAFGLQLPPGILELFR